MVESTSLRSLFPESDGSIGSASNKHWFYWGVVEPSRSTGAARRQSCNLFSSKCIPDNNLKTKHYHS